MSLISQAQAEPLIAPHAVALYEIPRKAWDEYHAKLPQDMIVHLSPRTRASAVHDLMLKNAAIFASETPSIGMFDANMMRGLVIQQLLAVRLKKLDEESASRSRPTEQVVKFRNQEPLDGVDALHNLELGYVLNDDETDIVEVRLVCPSGANVAWVMRLGPSGASASTIEMFPMPGPNDKDNSKPPKIAPKKHDGVVLPLRKRDRKDEN